MISSFFGKILLVTAPVFSLSDARLANTARKKDTLILSNSFEGLTAKSYVNVIAAGLIKFLVFISGTIVIGGIGALLGLMGYAMGGLNPDMIIPAIVLASPAALVLVAFYFMLPIVFGPLNYIIDSNPEIALSKALYNCLETMKQNGKMAYFLTQFIYSLYQILYLALSALLFYVLYFILGENIGQILAIIVTVIAFVGYIFVAPIIDMARRVCLSKIFEEIANTSNDTDTTIDTTKEHISNRSKQKALKAKEKEQLLVSLFSDGEAVIAEINDKRQLEIDKLEKIEEERTFDHVNAAFASEEEARRAYELERLKNMRLENENNSMTDELSDLDDEEILDDLDSDDEALEMLNNNENIKQSSNIETSNADSISESWNETNRNSRVRVVKIGGRNSSESDIPTINTNEDYKPE